MHALIGQKINPTTYRQMAQYQQVFMDFANQDYYSQLAQWCLHREFFLRLDSCLSLLEDLSK